MAGSKRRCNRERVPGDCCSRFLFESGRNLVDKPRIFLFAVWGFNSKIQVQIREFGSSSFELFLNNFVEFFVLEVKLDYFKHLLKSKLGAKRSSTSHFL
jgi:hypothetical protein